MSTNKIVKLCDLTDACIQSLKQLYEGRILTIIDACIYDREQRKAIKDLIRQSIWDDEAHSKMIFAHLANYFSSKNMLAESLNETIDEIKKHSDKTCLDPENNLFLE